MSEDTIDNSQDCTGPYEQRFQALAENIPNGGVALFDSDLRHTAAMGRGSESLPIEPTEFEGKTVREVFPPDRYEESATEYRSQFEEVDTLLEIPDTYEEFESNFKDVLAGAKRTFEVPFSGRLFRIRAVPIEARGGDDNVGMILTQDITEGKERELKLKRQRDELERLNRIHRLIEDVIKELREPTSRDEIETVVCESLVESDLYTSTTIVERELETEGFTPRAWAGIDDSYFEVITENGSDTIERGTVGDVLRSGTTQVVQRIVDDSKLPDPMCEELLDRGIESVIVLPLTYRERIDGALIVRADRPYAFSEREQAALETLANAVSFAINAVRNQALLLTGGAIELEFKVPASGGFFAEVSETLDCTCIHAGDVPIDNGNVVHYIRVEGATADSVVELAEEAEQIERCRVIEDRDDECRIEVIVQDPPPQIFFHAGATLRSIVADEGTSTVIAEVLRESNVREVVNAFRDRYPEAELVAKREVSSTHRTANRFRQTLEERLTDKQLAALRTAYLSGYYEYPRGSNVQEIANTLDIADSTLHQHLQAAHRKLLERFFGGDKQQVTTGAP